MIKRTGLFINLILFIVIFTGCGPAETGSDANVEAVWTDFPITVPTITPTPTSTPTPTPTPVPYGLNVLVIDEGELPVFEAIISVSELDDESGTLTTDNQGAVSWADLPGEIVTLSVSAQGYLSVELSEVIGRGDNQLTIALERDPFGILTSEACAPGETLLYVEDFQDGHAQGWETIEYGAQGWALGSYPDTPENKVISHTLTSKTWARLADAFYENAVF